MALSAPLSPPAGAFGNDIRVASVRNPKSKIENPKYLEFPRSFERGLDGCKRQQQKQGSVRQRYCTVGGVPLRRPLILGVDEKGYPADFRRHEQTAPSCCQDQLTAQPLSLDRTIHRQSPQPKDRYFMLGEAFAIDLRHAGVFK